MTNEEAAKFLEEIFLHVRYGRCNGKTEATRRYDEAMIAAVTALRSSEKKMSEWYWDMDNLLLLGFVKALPEKKIEAMFWN